MTNMANLGQGGRRLANLTNLGQGGRSLENLTNLGQGGRSLVNLTNLVQDGRRSMGKFDKLGPGIYLTATTCQEALMEGYKTICFVTEHLLLGNCLTSVGRTLLRPAEVWLPDFGQLPDFGRNRWRGTPSSSERLHNI